MKISNSKKELANIISENGGWRKGSYAAQDYVIRFFAGDKPKYNKATKLWDADNSGLRIMEIGGVKLLQNRQHTILSIAEYFHLYPVSDADGWIECDGNRPVGIDFLVDVKYANGTVECGFWADGYDWNWNGGGLRIIAYRPHKSEQSAVESRLADAVDIVKSAAPALMSDDMKFTGDEVMGERKSTIEQLAADYRNKLDYADRKQDEADKARIDSDAALAELEKAIASIGFAITPIGAVEQELELVSTDWRDWMVGDFVELALFQGGCAKVGEVGEISKVLGGGEFYVDFPSQSGYSVKYSHIKFISRPAK